ncbi:undecaprenyl-diphosphate phosphatase [Candidatus Pacearchaeota archaeon]|nr:undecaprenyl-diphosphate phosphatase [Candidatus Pacearchaeota archaeon]
MLTEIILAIVQAATEFLPVSSSGHLSLVSNLISKPNLFFFTTLHLASLIAVLIFTRKEIFSLLKFDKKSKPLWTFLIIATAPAAIFGFLFHEIIEKMFSSYLFLGIAFIFTGIILLLTKFTKVTSKFNTKNALVIGLFQVLALFPGISRSGMTISSGMFLGLNREKAARFSFLLLIPLVLAAFIFKLGTAYISVSLVVAFFICLFTSLLFLNLLTKMIKDNKFWLFGFYCLAIGIITLLIYFRT